MSRVGAVLHDPGVEIGPFRILPRSDGRWIAYDERQPFGRRTAYVGADQAEVSYWAEAAIRGVK